MISKTLYEILGVEVDATAHQIKRAYRKLAKRMHPDKLPDSEKVSGAEKFRELTNAYEVLSDPQRQQHYDETVTIPKASMSDPEKQLNALLANFIMHAMQQNPMGCNPIAVVKEIIGKQIGVLRAMAQGDKEIAKRFRHISKNVVKHGEGENVISGVLENHAAGAETHANQLLAESENLAKFLNLLGEYSWYPGAHRRNANIPEIAVNAERWVNLFNP